MSTSTAVATAADRLWAAWHTGQACAPIRELIGTDDINRAYEIQRRNEARLVQAGDRVVGRKIGLTSKAVQTQLGVNQPDFGPLFASRAVQDGGVVDLAGMIAPRIEAEIALVLGDPISNASPTRDDVLAATAHVAAALEVVDSRVRDWDITIVDTIADFASGAAFVLGATRCALDDQLDLTSVPMRMYLDDDEVCSGVGAASLGDPLEAAVWLARTLAEFGTPLVGGDVVLTGALGPFVEISAGQRVRADLGPLGSVACTIGRGTS